MMAVTQREQQMLDLAEDGWRPGQIAREMQIKEASVRRILQLLSGNPAADIAREAEIRAGSQRLLEAQYRANQFSSRRYVEGPAR